MALLRCPQCDTGHELDNALLEGGPRRVRCASCRTIWLAEPEAAAPSLDDWDLALEPQTVSGPDTPAEPNGQADIDSLFDEPLKGAPEAPQSQDDIDGLFATPAPADGPRNQNDIDSLFDEPPAKAASEPIVVATPPPADDEALREERRSERRRKAAEDAAKERPLPVAEPVRAKSLAAMFLAASVGTFATLLIFRHDVATLWPWSVPFYESIGLGIEDKGLFFEDVRSRVMREDGRETLEVIGTIHNRTSHRQIVPMLRLAIRSEAGQEVYVWTATADQADIGPGDRLRFRRRLASPPSEAHAVEVRFVSKQDIVASVR